MVDLARSMRSARPHLSATGSASCMRLLWLSSAGALALSLAVPTVTAFADDGLVAICGNTCVGEENNGDPLCHWAPAAPGQSCKAKGICSPSECTVWWTARAPAVDALATTAAQAKRLPGARTYKGPRPPSP
jgi:hypothetical protein